MLRDQFRAEESGAMGTGVQGAECGGSEADLNTSAQGKRRVENQIVDGCDLVDKEWSIQRLRQGGKNQVQKNCNQHSQTL